jgi:hypothetical protein
VTVRLCQREECRKPITGNGKRFCGQRCAGKMAPKWAFTPKAMPKPIAAGSSWWLGLDRAAFYVKCRELFPDDAGDKSQAPVQTYGGYERGLMVTGKERLRDRREREELR